MKACLKNATQIEWFDFAGTLPMDWDDELPENHFLKRASLLVHELSEIPHVTCCFALQRNAEKIVARAAFQIITVRPEHLSSASLPAYQYTAWRFYTQIFKPKLLVGGQLFRHDVNTAFFGDCLSPFESFTWYRQALKLAAKTCGVQAILIKDPLPELIPLFINNAPDCLLLRNDSSMQMVIPNSWKELADYEKSLKHKYAQRFRKLRQSWTPLEIRALSSLEVQTASKEIYDLYLQVTENQSVRMGFLSEKYFPELKNHYGDKLSIWGIYEANKMIAFASGWNHESCFDMFYIGFDYVRNQKLNLYFNILFFSVEQAILNKKSRLNLGRTALEAKARVGCSPFYLNTFLRIQNPILRRIVGALQHRLGEQGNEWEQRHPFKPGKLD